MKCFGYNGLHVDKNRKYFLISFESFEKIFFLFLEEIPDIDVYFPRILQYVRSFYGKTIHDTYKIIYLIQK